MDGVKRISASLLQGIADALRVKSGTTVLIAPADFAQMLHSFKVGSIGTVAAPAALTGDGEERFISEYILQEIADELKRLYDTTDLIPVAEYANRILALDVVGFVGDETLEETPAPTLSVIDGVLKITGAGAAVYAVYIDSERYIDLNATSGMSGVDFSTLNLADGIHTIVVVSVSASGISSNASNIVTYKVGGEAEEENGDAIPDVTPGEGSGNESGDDTPGEGSGNGGDDTGNEDEGGDDIGGGEVDETIIAPTLSIVGDTLTITGEGAYQYLVYVDGVKKATVDVENFDLSTIGLNSGTYSITAVSVSSSGKQSVESAASEYIVLPAAPSISVLGDILTITGERADHYKIYVDGEENATSETATFNLSTLGLKDGEYAITVCLVSASGLVSEVSEAVAYTMRQLLTPTVTISDGVLTITGEGGEYYAIYKDGKIIKSVSVDTPSYDLAANDYPVGSYEITVTAYSMVNGALKHSAHSAPVTYTVAAPDAPVIAVSANKIVYIKSEESDDYEHAIYIDGVYKGTWGYGYKSFNIGKFYGLPVGEYIVTIRAVKGDWESPESNAVVYKVEVTDEPAPEAPIVTYLGYNADADSYSFKVETKEKVYGVKSRVTGAIEREYTTAHKGGLTTTYDNKMANTNGTYYASYAVANRLGVYGEYSEPIEYVVDTCANDAPAAPTLTLDTTTDKLKITPAQPNYMRVVVFANNVQISNMNYIVNGVPWYQSGSRYIYNVADKLRDAGLEDGVYSITAKVEDLLGMVNNKPVAGYWSQLSDPVQYTLGEVEDTGGDEGGDVGGDIPDDGGDTGGDDATYTVTLTEDGVSTCYPYDGAEYEHYLYRVGENGAELVSERTAEIETVDFASDIAQKGNGVYYVVCKVMGYGDDDDWIAIATCTSNTITVGGDTGGWTLYNFADEWSEIDLYIEDGYLKCGGDPYIVYGSDYIAIGSFENNDPFNLSTLDTTKTYIIENGAASYEAARLVYVSA